jgi:hypothetical protein
MLGQHADLDQAMLLHGQALELRPSGHPNRSVSLDNLANTFQMRFEQSGQLGDLNQVVMLYKQALELHPAAIPLQPCQHALDTV